MGEKELSEYRERVVGVGGMVGESLFLILEDVFHCSICVPPFKGRVCTLIHFCIGSISHCLWHAVGA